MSISMYPDASQSRLACWPTLAICVCAAKLNAESSAGKRRLVPVVYLLLMLSSANDDSSSELKQTEFCDGRLPPNRQQSS